MSSKLGQPPFPPSLTLSLSLHPFYLSSWKHCSLPGNSHRATKQHMLQAVSLLLYSFASNFSVYHEFSPWITDNLWQFWYEIYISSIVTPFSDHRPHMCHTTHHYLLSIRKRIISCFNLQCYSAMRLRCYMHSLAIRMWIVWVSGMSALIIGDTLWSDCSPALKKINKHKTLLVQAQ